MCLERFCQAIANLKLDALGKRRNRHPVAGTRKPKYFTELIEDAKQLGARIVNEGRHGQRNLFYPAVMYPVTSEMRLYREEQFGPVIPVISFDDIEVPIQYIVDSDYGQQVSIFGQDASMIAKLVDPS